MRSAEPDLWERQEQLHQHLRRKTKFLPKFCNTVDPLILLPHLSLATPHEETVRNKCQLFNKHSGCQCLWDFMTKEIGWFPRLQQALQEHGYSELYLILTKARMEVEGGNGGGEDSSMTEAQQESAEVCRGPFMQEEGQALPQQSLPSIPVHPGSSSSQPSQPDQQP